MASRPSDGVTSAGVEAVELAAAAGLDLDPWQADVLDVALSERADGKWSAFEVGLVVPRQNGKGSILEARELAGLFLLGERLILHSAHEFKTAAEGFRRVMSLIDNTDFLRKQVKRVNAAHGDEGIELLSGARLRFVARSNGSGRGFSGDCVILDEAYNLGANAMAALLPTLSARPNPQLWYASSAGMDSSEQLRRVRERAIAGGDPGLAYSEWSAVESADLDDPNAWAAANPALGIRIPEQFVERERAALPEVEFARERLGIWDAGGRAAVIPAHVWDAVADSRSQPNGRPVFAIDMSPDRSRVSIGMAGARFDGRTHVELVENRNGTDWVVERVVELVKRWKPEFVVVDAGSPAGGFIGSLKGAGVPVLGVGTREVGQACGAFYDAVTAGKLRHIDQPLLNTALGAARKRPLGDAWAWHRMDATDISPLVAVTLAVHGQVKASGVKKGLTRVTGRVLTG